MQPSVLPSDGAEGSQQSEVADQLDGLTFAGRRARLRRWLLRVGVVVSSLGMLAFYGFNRSRVAPASSSTAAMTSAEAPEKNAWAVLSEARENCLRERERLLEAPTSPGIPELDANRVELLMRTKVEPVLFVSKPEPEPEVPKTVAGLRHSLYVTKYPSTFLDTLVKAFRVRPLLGRQILLRNGYLYADEPELAFAMVHHVRAEYLYDDPRIWIQRGDALLIAERMPSGKYRYTNGSLQGKEVSLILFDRIGTGAPPPALHRDVRSLRYRLHFDGLDVTHLTATHLVADLRYGGLTIPTVLKADGPRLELACEAVPPARARDLALYRERGEKRLAAVQGLRRVMRAQIEEQLPFDEPYREWGQQDGVLRYKWRDAYLGGKGRFDLNGDTYYVFDPEGRAKIPQVCIDFLTDTLERASGTWWQRYGEKPARRIGKFDFNTLEKGELRRADMFVQHARDNPEWFHVYDTPPEEHIPFWRKQAFTEYLTKHAHRFLPGDMVLIRGFTNFEKKWERPIMHYHSFFIYESDPLTGLPIAIVGNAHVPALRTWNTEMRRTPRRSIWHRIRPQLHWLESIVQTPDQPDLEPAPLALGSD